METITNIAAVGERVPGRTSTTLVHDHRNFGTSGGDLRGDIDPWLQIRDWRRAISFLEARPEVDPTRIGLWGTSDAGGHALVLGASVANCAAQNACGARVMRRTDGKQ
jgi:dienelactone hydrolase